MPAAILSTAMTLRDRDIKGFVHSNELTRCRRPIDDDKIRPRRDWELAQLPSRFIRQSLDGETVTHENLRWALMNQERITSDIADLVIQPAIDDGIVARENSRVLRLLESEMSGQLKEGNDGE